MEFVKLPCKFPQTKLSYHGNNINKNKDTLQRSSKRLVQFPALQTAQAIQRRVIGCSVNDESERKCKEAVVA
jgi:hypothetical protein